MTSDERALVDRVELVLGRSMAIALPADMANRAHAKWTNDLGPALLALVRRLDAECERMRDELTCQKEQEALMREAAEWFRAHAREHRNLPWAREAADLADRLEGKA